jgi:hypothetical protein
VNSNAAHKKPFHRKIFLLFIRFMFAISRKHNRKGFNIAALSSGQIAFPKIDQALNLISKFDSRSYFRIQRDIEKMWVSAMGPDYAAEWIDELKMCVFNRDHICRADISADEVASTIIHEATHARLSRFKISYKEEKRIRIEKICFKAQIAFAKRLPDGEHLIQKTESNLELPETFWTNSEFQQRNLKALAELGKKLWPARILYPIASWLVDKRKR